MRVALTADIHANLPALTAVLTHARRLRVDAHWDLGDFLGAGGDADAVAERLMHDNVVGILGNDDRKVLQSARRRSSSAPAHGTTLRDIYAQLSPACQAYLCGLPRQRRLCISPWDILMVPGSPAAKERLGPSTSAKRLAELARLADCPYVLCGHAPRPFLRTVAGTTFISPGSVGRSHDGKPCALYAVLDINPEGIEVHPYRVAYRPAAPSAGFDRDLLELRDEFRVEPISPTRR